VLIRYHLDEHIDAAVADELRRRGIDVTTSFEEQLIGVPDAEQLAFTLSEGRVMVTRDRDFLRLHAANVPHAGIVFWHSKRRSLGELIAQLEQLSQSIPAEAMAGQVQFL
jgi:hypothetical protein